MEKTKRERNITCVRLTATDMEYILHVNPEKQYLCIEHNLISVLAQLTGEQLKELFSALEKKFREVVDTDYDKVQDPMVKALFNVIDNKGTQWGRFVIDFTGATL